MAREQLDASARSMSRSSRDEQTARSRAAAEDPLELRRSARAAVEQRTARRRSDPPPRRELLERARPPRRAVGSRRQPSTEDLRVALMRDPSFFDHLLSAEGARQAPPNARI